MKQDSLILSVFQLTQAIKYHLETNFSFICVQGEITNFTKQSSGHYYFSLKDTHAQISVVMFRGENTWLKNQPKNGDKVIIKGEINVYPKRGNYQIIARNLQFAGFGELLIQFEKLKEKLKQKGWFDPVHKKTLPLFPKRIGVVTSPTGAVIQDIVHVLERRYSGIHLILNPVRVQGQGAGGEIAKAIDEFNRYQLVDVIIIGRGGGSIEDLRPFNEEIVAESVFKSEIPIISAVGHETDFSISDMVADIRAPTPSAAAEIVVTEKKRYLELLFEYHQRLSQTLTHLVKKDSHRLKGVLRQPLFTSPYALLGSYFQSMDEMQNRLDGALTNRITTLRLQLDMLKKQKEVLNPLKRVFSLRKELLQWEKNIRNKMKHKMVLYNEEILKKTDYLDRTLVRKLNNDQEKLKRLVAHLTSIDPKNLLKKGYSILFDEKKDSVIVSARDLIRRQVVCIQLSDGDILAKIEEVKL